MTEEEKKAVKNGVRIVQTPKEISVCTGCNACEIVCGLVHEGKNGPSMKRITVKRDTINLEDHQVYTCQHCVDAPCYHACPKKDLAMCHDPERNIYYINEEECIGCKKCVKACPFEPKRILFDTASKKAKKCDLCRDREEGPACIEYCQVRCLELAEKEAGRSEQ